MVVVNVDVDVDVGVVNVDWDKASPESSDVNLLVLSDRLRDCYSNHVRLRKHLYRDRNQMIGESELRRYSTYLVFLDYIPYNGEQGFIGSHIAVRHSRP
jgi:hypothetical protein